jgi:multisubunit Na+/H+ antiporter MnhF subunit
MLATLPGLVAGLRGSAADGAVSLQLVGAQVSLAVVAMAEGFGRSVLLDVALVAAVVSVVSGLAFARFLERWL